MIAYYNGEYLPKENISISPDDRGFLLADGLYEVVRFYNGKPFKLDQHRQNDLEGVESGARGEVIVQIRVVNPVQPPECRDRMNHHVLQIDHQIHQHDRRQGSVYDQPRIAFLVDGIGAIIMNPVGVERERRETKQQDRIGRHRPAPGPRRDLRQHLQRRRRRYRRAGLPVDDVLFFPDA